MIQIPSMAKDRRDQSFDIKITRSAAAAEGEVSPLITRRLAKLDISLEKGIAMLSKEVQDLVDKSRKATDFFKSVDQAMGALKKQNDEMKAKIEEIANRPPVVGGEPPAAGVPASEGTVVYALSDEDKAALLEVTKSFDDAIDSLKDDIPANTEATNPNVSSGEAGQIAQGDQSGSAPAPQNETSSDQSSSTGTDTQVEQQPQVADATQHAQDAQAASQAKPLDGTGAPEPDAKQDPGA